jgi:hypothetical protein
MMSKRAANAIAFVSALMVALLALTAGPAEAHSASNTPASNYVTKVLSIRTVAGNGCCSDEPPFTLKSIEAGSRLELQWENGPEIVVPDYDGFPYLRIGSNGTFENQESNATYLNRDRNGSANIPDGLNPKGKPRWKKISSDPIARWHDHRAHRMGGDPPQVRKQPGRAHLVQRNELEILQGADANGQMQSGTRKFKAVVEVRWKPGPSSMPWLAFAGALAVGIAAWSLVGGRTIRGRKRLRIPLTLAVLTLVVVDVVHLLGIAFGVRGTVGEGLGRAATIGFGSFAAWIAAFAGLALFLKRRDDGLYLVTFAAGLMALVGGFSDMSSLGQTSVPFAFSTIVARVVITLTIGLGVGLLVAGVLLTRPIVSAPAGEAAAS